MGNDAYLVFPGDTDSQGAVARVHAAVRSLWPHAGARVQPDHALLTPSTEVYTWPERATGSGRISLTLNHAIPAVFVSVESSGRMSTLTAEFRRLLALPSASDHTALAATCPDDPAALVRAALAAGTEDEPALRQLVEAALEKTNPTIRAGGIQAAALLGWSSLAAPLLLAAAVEEDEDLKRQIRIALRKCTSTT